MTLGMIMSLMAGIGLFLYGMKMMGEGLEKAAGDNLRRLLQVLTRNRFTGLVVGTAFTAVIQSSAATIVMVVGFVNASLMSLTQATGVIMGANIGTTITGHLVALRLTDIAPIFVFTGVVMMLFFKKTAVQRIGTVICGFGVLFLGMGMMSSAMAPLGQMESFIAVMTSFSNPVLAMLAGVAFTALIQSSSAAVGVVQTMAMNGLMPLETAVYITLGTGIGTCITALLSSIGTNHAARRAAIIHLLLNVFGTALILGLLQILPAMQWIRSTTLDQSHISQQIANANTLFKVFEVMVFMPLTPMLVKISKIIVPGEDPKAGNLRLMYLDERILTTPPIAVLQLTKEVERMGHIAVDNLKLACECFFEENAQGIRVINENEKLVNFLNHEITRFMVKANQLELPPRDVRRIGAMFHVVNDLERIGDHAENMSEFAVTRYSDGIPFSAQGVGEMREMLGVVLELCNLSIEAFHTRNRALLPRAKELEDRVDRMEKEFQQAHVDRLTQGLCTPSSGMIFSDILSNLERVADHATNIAFSIEEEDGLDRATAAE